MFSHVVSVLVLQWMLLCKIVVQVRLTVDDMCKRRFISEYYRRALATLEPLMGEAWCVRCRPYVHVIFSSCDIDAVLDFVCTVSPFRSFLVGLLRVRFYIINIKYYK